MRPPSSARSGLDRLGLHVIIALVILACILLLNSMAAAQDLPPLRTWDGETAELELPELVMPACPRVGLLRAFELEGARGMWFPREAAECMLGRLLTLQQVIPYVRLLEQRLDLDDGRNALQERRVALGEQQVLVAQDALEAAIRRAREAEEARDAWYRHPALWAVIGAVVAVALEVVAIVIFHEVR